MKRRGFLKYCLTSLGGLSLLSALPACSSFDEYLFDEHEFLKDQVIIIGGGITGLYLAQKLRQLKTEFRLFEGASVFGGRIRSNNELDFGASVFEQTDVHLKKLVQDLNLTETALGKTQFVMNSGAESVTQELQQAFPNLVQPLWHRVIAEKRATFSCDVNLHRPTHLSSYPNLLIAGDYTYSDYPSTIEGAVRSGISCAEYVIADLL